MNLPDWFAEWQAWLGIAVALGVAEVFSLDLVLLMLATGALVGMITSLVGLTLWIQVLAAVGASVAMLALVRPNVVRRLHAGPELTLGHDALVGQQGLVVGQVSRHGGQITIGSDLWTARPYDEFQVIEPGAAVEVLQIRGATAYVHPVPSLEE